ncbi:diguanylate cyclase [uncultured Thiodictyon sp.]|uniref:GGDEF domain-containing response regulator n=1 Tax=uncultured Thiodictyon sp. TaxID=1846217 RepID=UPI0025E18442|nr:diguanylate cyclase [uncultured Thiodictyon sp.]
MAATESAQILIIDDTRANVAVLSYLLADEYAVRFASSGPQAFDLLAQGARPDLILLDVVMPGMDGYAVCAKLKANPATRDIPVILITAATDEDSETQALNAGGVDFIQTPVKGAVVRARVRLHLELQRNTRALEESLAEIARTNKQLKVLWQAFEQSPTSIVITAADATIQYVNPQFTEQSGYTPAEAIGQNPRILNSGLTPTSTFDAMWSSLTRGEPWKGELINRRKSGEVYWEEAHLAPVKDDAGQIAHYIAVKLDITERKQAYERIAYMAHHDALTDLPNRSLFFEQVAQALERARRHGNRLALLFIDLDKFKPINDSCGHAVGDLVLQVAAKRITGRLRAADTVGRIGGDEFVVLLTDVQDDQGAMEVAEGIGEALRQPIILDDKTLSISSSIGMAYYPDHGSDAIELARHADEAMYQAKERGRDRLKVFQTGGYHDKVTGVYNRPFLEKQVALECARAQRSGNILSLLLIAIDDFNAYTERFGHPAGDDALRLVAKVLESKFQRPGDLVARYGAEAFACLLPATDFEPARQLAEQIEHAVRTRALGHASSSQLPSLTVHIGIATRRRALDGDSAALLQLAEEQLGQAKQRSSPQIAGKLLVSTPPHQPST